MRAVRRDRTLTPAERDRVEMVLLSDGGRTVGEIAAHLGCCRATVRTVLKGFPVGGTAGLRRRAPGPPPDAERRAQVIAALDRLLGQARTWTAAQLAEALVEEGIALSTRQTRRYLQAMGARWRRTVRTVAHKQNAAQAAAATAKLTMLKKKPPPATSASPSSMSAASAPASR